MAIKVLTSGIYTSIQDLGRFGYRKFGVPVSGAMDAFSAELANRLVGNEPNCAVIEITLQGPVLEFQRACKIALTGADFRPKLGKKAIHMNTLISVSEGDQLTFGSPQMGARCYLAVSGGVASEVVMGSRSQYREITPIRQMQRGDLIPLVSKPLQIEETHSAVRVPPDRLSNPVIEVFPGPEFDFLSDELQKKISSIPFSVTQESNRMAYVLDSEKSMTAEEIITSPVQPGTVQLTPSGKVVVLMRDAQTTGGYARILQLTKDSVDRLAQKRAGDQLQFKLL